MKNKIHAAMALVLASLLFQVGYAQEAITEFVPTKIKVVTPEQLEPLQYQLNALEARVAALENATPDPPSGGLLFESDISGVPLGLVSATTNVIVREPFGNFDGYSVSSGGSALNCVMDGNDKVLQLNYEPGSSQPNITIYKHIGEGQPEVFVEMEIKFSDGFVMSNGASGNNGYHKLLRAWQNCEADGSWSGEESRGYVVANYSPGKTDGYHRNQLAIVAAWKQDMGGNSGSVDGPRQSQKYWGRYEPDNLNCGYLEPHTGPQTGSPGALPSGQTYHKIQWRLKLASPGQADGYAEIWIDGHLQDACSHPTALGGATAAESQAMRDEVLANDYKRLFTEVMDGGTGFQLFHFFDNMQFVSSLWGNTQHSIYLRSVKVSENFIE